MRISACLFLLMAFYTAWPQIQRERPDVDTFPLQKDTAYVNRLNLLAAQHFNAAPEKTRQYAIRALRMADSLYYEKGKADALLNIGRIHALKGDYPSELEVQLQALKLYEALRDSVSIARAYDMIGVTHHRLNDLPGARLYYSKALTLFRKQNNHIGLATLLRRIGNFEMDVDSIAQGLDYYLQALAFERKLNHEEGIANVLNNIAVAYIDQHKPEQAEPYIREAITILKKINNLNRLPAAYYNLNQIYLARNQVDEALQLAHEELRLAEQLQLRPAIMEATRVLSDIYTRRKDYEKALGYYRWHAAVTDSIENQANGVKFARLQSLYTLEQKEQELTVIKAEKALSDYRQRLLLCGSLLLLLMTAYIVYVLRKRMVREKAIAQKDHALLQAQQQLMQAELENKVLSEKQLQQDLEFRNRELLSHTLHFAHKNTLMEQVREDMLELQNIAENKSFKSRISRLAKVIDDSLEVEKDWHAFRMYFEKVHSAFFQNLKEQFPELSQTDLKLCALISLNLSMKETALLLGISPESVKMARHRLRKKLSLDTEENLTDFLANFKN
ncbi:MAG TPA: tetratricopeptide repeat protein [Ohtaekwangia sp.]|uniref:tetratricopeptide repeat protein n=1 Tax=Ohtaekwangia sp. TaxID=2066019 RepID=UPI002F93716F